MDLLQTKRSFRVGTRRSRPASTSAHNANIRLAVQLTAPWRLAIGILCARCMCICTICAIRCLLSQFTSQAPARECHRTGKDGARKDITIIEQKS